MSLRQNANLAALALIRQAVGYSDAEHPAGNVMDVLGPLLESARQDGLPDERVVRALLASLAQWAGAAFAAQLGAKFGRPPSKAELLDSLDEVEHALVAHPEED